ncbi:hypothetical protein ACFL05_00475 [Patescibacteria group bacterium]
MPERIEVAFGILTERDIFMLTEKMSKHSVLKSKVGVGLERNGTVNKKKVRLLSDPETVKVLISSLSKDGELEEWGEFFTIK